jgi:predicted Zn-dependent peptidase
VSRRYQNGEVSELAGIDDYSDRLGAVTSAALHQAAQRYLDPNNYVKVVLMPESK